MTMNATPNGAAATIRRVLLRRYEGCYSLLVLRFGLWRAGEIRVLTAILWLECDKRGLPGATALLKRVTRRDSVTKKGHPALVHE